MKIMKLLIGVLFLVSFSLFASQSHKKPGDGFREAAKKYEQKRKDTLKRAKASKHRAQYKQLSKVYQKMAAIKRRAGKLADQNKWDEVKWDDYHRLEKEKNQLLHQLKKKKHHTKKKNAHKHQFKQAAEKYERKAKSARSKAKNSSSSNENELYLSIADRYQKMAQIKMDAANLADKNQWGKMDWTEYYQLKKEKNKLVLELEDL